MPNLTDIIAENVSRTRKNAGLEGSELSNLTGISPEVIVSIENGTHRPTPEEIIILTDALKVNPSDLLSEPST